MSCCAVVIDSDGNMHYGYESGITGKQPSLVFPPKAYEIKNGVILLVGTVRAANKFRSDLVTADYDIFKIPKEDWWMGESADESKEPDNWECNAIQLKKDGSAILIVGPFEIYPISTPGFYAIGTGGTAAYGVLWHMLSGKKKVTAKEAKASLYRAIETACAVGSEACSLPITIETLEVA